jgi:hypothetical protein
MKGLLYFLFFVAVGAGLYFYFHKAENFRVKDQVIVSQASGMDISGPITAPPKYAVIKGTITNISDKNFNNVEVVYQSGLDTIRAIIGSLQKGQSSEFETNRMMVRSGHPDYELIDIPCNEE